MKVSLTPELERRIAEKVESGLYPTASEVVREGLRLLFSLDEARERQITRLRADIRSGLDELDDGAAVAVDDVFAEAAKLIEGRRSAS
jgi:antitoxin ParD1/3/4